MDSGQNPTSPMPGNGFNSAPQPTPVTPPASPTTPTPAAPTVPPAPVFSTAAPSPMATLNSRRNRSTRPNSANSMVAPAQPMTPTGDVIMDMPTTKPKSPINKGLIIGIIVAAVVIIGIIIVFLVTSGGASLFGANTNEEPTPSSSAAKESFNRMFHYIMDKSNSSSDISEDDIGKNVYLDSEHSPEEITDFLLNFSDVYNNFITDYSKTDGKIIPQNIYPYFYGYYKIDYDVSQINIIELYKSRGVEEAQNYIYETIAPPGNASETSTQLDDYIASRRNILTAYIALTPYAERAGCITDNTKFVSGCNLQNDSTSQELGQTVIDNTIAEQNLAMEMRSLAFADLFNLYNEIYGARINSESVK